MAAKKKNIIKVDANDVNIDEILSQGSKADYKDMLSAIGIIQAHLESYDQMVKAYEDGAKFLKNSISITDYDAVIKNLVENGVLNSEDEQLVVEVTVPVDDKSIVKTVTLNNKKSDNFALDETIYKDVMHDKIEKVIRESLTGVLTPEQFSKYIKLKFNQKQMEADLALGLLPAILLDYCSTSPTSKASITVSKGKEVE